MGNYNGEEPCSAEITVAQSKRSKSTYTNKDILKGTTVVTVNQPMLINLIDIVFVEIVKPSYRNDNTKKIIKGNMRRVVYIKNKLYPENKEQESNLIASPNVDNENQREYLLPKGEYKFPFAITIPMRRVWRRI